MELEKTQNIMGWVIASTILLVILSYFFPSLNKLFLVVFFTILVFFIWEKEQQIHKLQKELYETKQILKNNLPKKEQNY